MTVVETTAPESLARRLARAVKFVASGDGRQMRRYLYKLGVSPTATLRLIGAYHILQAPLDYLRRRRMAARLSKLSLAIRISEETGWARIPIGSFPEVDATIARMRKEFEAKKDNLTAGDPFRLIYAMPNDLIQTPEICDLVLSPNLVGMAAAYLGTVPVLQTVEGWYSPKNAGMDPSKYLGSQFYHRDQTDFRLVKFIFNIVDVTPEGGAFAFLSADVSGRVSDKIKNWRGRVSDEEIYRICQREDSLSSAGPAGSGAVVDSARCFHYGGRSADAERVVMMVSYCTRHAPLEHIHHMDHSLAARQDSELDKMVLNLR